MTAPQSQRCRNRARRAAGTRLALQGLPKEETPDVLLTILVILLLLALVSGGFGYSRGWGYYGWSPLGLLVLIVLVLALTGNLSL
jgi:hypothetical protein